MNGTDDHKINELVTHGAPHVPEVSRVVDEIVRLTHPVRVYLYNQKFGVSGGTTAFKLCVVAVFSDKLQAEKDIYLRIDSDVPFDVILYTPEEWDSLCAQVDSFARKILSTGMVVYG